MDSKTGSDSLDILVNGMLERLAEPGGAVSQLIGNAKQSTDVAFHDFSSYKYLLTPSRIRFSENEGGSIIDDLHSPDIPLDRWYDFETFVSHFRIEAQASIERWVHAGTTWSEREDEYVDESPINSIINRHIEVVILIAHEGFRLGMARALYEVYSSIEEKEDFIVAAQVAVDAWLLEQLNTMREDNGVTSLNSFYGIQAASFWEAGIPAVLAALSDYVDEAAVFEKETEEDRLPPNYSFDPYLADTINFGLQTVYRQSWTAKGTQPGEIVRTLPLGPGQTEKVSFKAIRRTKSTRQSEMSSSIETSTESSAAIKDSQEVVQEASEKSNWNVEGTSSADIGFSSGSITASAGGESASSSNDTKSLLNETMEKTASKIKQDTKLVVSTEMEETAEFNQSSEINNPNDEIAVTYIYSRLQRQYEIRTHLSEVNTVIFVAEKIPSPSEIGGKWIRKYDWIISQALLDDSFRDDLKMVSSYTSRNMSDENIDENINALMETLSVGNSPGLPSYSDLNGTLTLPDIFQTPQQSYEREVERKRARDTEHESYRRAVRRLSHHIHGNILHYCRAIWSSEDSDSRLMRFDKIRVPINWEFLPTETPTGHVIGGNYAPAIHDYEQDTVQLSELINPAGPIGFAGNYSVYYLRESTRWDSLAAVLGHLRMPYLKTVVEVKPEGDNDEELVLEGIVSDRRIDEGRYRLIFEVEPIAQFQVQKEEAAGVFSNVMTVSVKENRPLRFHSLSITIGPVSNLTAGDVFIVSVRNLAKLEDPELKSLRWSEPALNTADEPQFFTAEVLAEYAEYFTDARAALVAEGDAGSDWLSLSSDTQALLRRRYYQYLLRKRYSRHISLDTNNLILNREVDPTSTLEPFKGLHRLADALGAFEETKQKRLESERKRKRIELDKLGDPDIEKVTVVAGTGEFAELAALDGIGGEPTFPAVPEDDG